MVDLFIPAYKFALMVWALWGEWLAIMAALQLVLGRLLDWG